MSSKSHQLDRPTLRRAGQILVEAPPVDTVNPFPSGREEKLIVDLDPTLYPDLITAIELQLELRTNGDFHNYYIENWSGEIRECRWDRHDNNHNTRDHYHPFPDANRVDAEDRDFPDDFFRLLEEVILLEIEVRWGNVCGELR